MSDNYLRKTRSGIFYLNDYVPTRKFRFADEELQDYARELWRYKDGGDASAFYHMTNDLADIICDLGNRTRSDKIGLVAVPPSKVEKYSPIRESISRIKFWSDVGVLRASRGFEKAVYDYGQLLTRRIDSPTKHEGADRLSEDEEMATIQCSRDRLSRYWTAFIILDDITTSGDSLNICEKILINHGANKEYIYKAALARTVR